MLRRARYSLLAGAVLAAGCSSTHAGAGLGKGPAWSDTTVNAVSRPVTGAGFTAVTGLRPDGRLQTAVFDLASGHELWTRAATMSGRPAGMGVEPPAIVGASDHAEVVDLEPGQGGTSVTARDARTGRQIWARSADSTFGPAACGDDVCLSESTARKSARFTAFSAATGEPIWHIPGIAEVEWSDPSRVVLFRMAAHPSVEARTLGSGSAVWRFPVENAVGKGVNLSGGWAFGATGANLIGYVAPYESGQKGNLSAFGFFSLGLAEGQVQWARRDLLRVYPSANPAVALLAREVAGSPAQYSAFAQLDPTTGRTVAALPAKDAPRADWWLAFPGDLSSLGFLTQGKPGHLYDLRTGSVAGDQPGWSFCTTTPGPLRIEGQQGFYPIAALCPFDVAKGRRLDPAATPPGWYTGSVDGWRVWRDQSGGLHAIHDATGSSPGMYG